MVGVKQATNRGLGIKRIQALKHATEKSVGLTVDLTMAHQEFRYLINQYEAIQERIMTHEASSSWSQSSDSYKRSLYRYIRWFFR